MTLGLRHTKYTFDGEKAYWLGHNTPEEKPMNYVQVAREALVMELGVEFECEAELVDLYTLLVLIRGTQTTMEDVHDSWAVWRDNTNSDHASIVPFEELSEEIQEYDRVYMEAIHRAAESLL